MKQPCKECLVGPICNRPCGKLVKYVKKNSKIETAARPGWLKCKCRSGYYMMTTHGAFVTVCDTCNFCDMHFFLR